MISARRVPFSVLPLLPVLLAVVAPSRAAGDISVGLGAGGYVSPVPSDAADGASRAGFVVEAAANYPLIPELSVGLMEIGCFGGGDFELAPSDNASERVLNSATAAVLTRVWESERFQGDFGVSLGAGPFYLSDRIDHSGASLSSSGWGPMGLVQCTWAGSWRPDWFYRLRLAWIWASTDLAVADNPGYRQKSDWSRLEATIGLGLKL